MNINISDVREMLECGTATNMELTEAVEFLLRERRALGREIVRLKIAHLRRMAEACEALESRALAFAFPGPDLDRWTDDRYWKIIKKVDRFRSACLAKIAELKELQCSTKS